MKKIFKRDVCFLVVGIIMGTITSFIISWYFAVPYYKKQLSDDKKNSRPEIQIIVTDSNSSTVLVHINSVNKTGSQVKNLSFNIPIPGDYESYYNEFKSLFGGCDVKPARNQYEDYNGFSVNFNCYNIDPGSHYSVRVKVIPFKDFYKQQEQSGNKVICSVWNPIFFDYSWEFENEVVSEVNKKVDTSKYNYLNNCLKHQYEMYVDNEN